MTREIVILSRSLPFHGLGGMEIVAWDLAREFARSGHAVRIITTSLPGRSGEFEQDGVCVAPLPGTPTARYSSAWWSASRRYFEERCMESTQAVLSVSAAGFGILPLRRRLPGMPFVMQAHGTSWGEVLSKWRSRRPKSILTSLRNVLWLGRDLYSYPRFDAVVAVGEKVCRDLTSRPITWTLPAQKVHQINNGIDTSLFLPSYDARLRLRQDLHISLDAPVLATACRLHPQKGVDHLLLAFSEFLKTSPNAVLLIAGDGPERSRLEQLCSELQISTSVQFLGAIDRNDVAKTLQGVDVFMFLTERIEGLPLNVLEALACGLPCIISNHLNIFKSDLITKISPREALSAIQVLESILERPNVKRSNALPTQYTLEYSSNQYLCLIKSLIDSAHDCN